MSLTLNMVGGGSGGGISANSALLVVYAPVGSIVTATKDSVTKTSKKDIALSDRPMVGLHLISIGSSQFGTWTVTATRDTDTNSTTVTINTTKNYDVYIGYHVPLQTYQEVEYLQATGTQFINSGLANVNGIDIDFQYTDTAQGQAVYGARNAWSSLNAFGINTYQNKFFYIPVPADSYSQYMPNADVLKHNFKYGSNVGWRAEFDGVTLYSYSQMAVSSNAVRLFCEYVTNAGNGNHAKAKIFHCALYVNGTLGRDYYPCYRLSDSVAGMYDKVNDVFYPNNGSGTFTVGADV